MWFWIKCSYLLSLFNLMDFMINWVMESMCFTFSLRWTYLNQMFLCFSMCLIGSWISVLYCNRNVLLLLKIRIFDFLNSVEFSMRSICINEPLSTIFSISEKHFYNSLIIFFCPFRFQVSRVVWDFLMTKCMELRHLKHKYGLFASKKSSGRYRPYSNVDFFLKVMHHFWLNTY